MPSRMAAPKYDILLQPRSADGPALSRLQVTITLESRERKSRQLLFCLEPVGGTPPNPYTVSNAQVTDDIGSLDISLTDSDKGSLSCTLGRVTVCDVVLIQDVTPKVATVNDKMHAYTEVCCDQGALIGVGHWFLPRIPHCSLTGISPWHRPARAGHGASPKGRCKAQIQDRTTCIWGPCSWPALL